MARRDGTGPLGRGSIDGRGLGFCTKTNATRDGKGLGVGLLGLGLGLGTVCRKGFENGSGRGFRRNFIENQDMPKTQKELLIAQKEMLETRIDSISKQLQNL